MNIDEIIVATVEKVTTTFAKAKLSTSNTIHKVEAITTTKTLKAEASSLYLIDKMKHTVHKIARLIESWTDC